MTLKEFLAAIADAIRGKEGSTEDIPAPEFPQRIEAIQTGVTLPTLTNPGAAADLRQGKQLIDQSGAVVDGTLVEVEQATPSISVSSAGLITATAGDKSATKQLSTQAGGTRTPGTSDTTIVYAGQYATGNITMKGDANLIPANIKSGVSIFGVSGTASGGYKELTFWGTDTFSSSSLADGTLTIKIPLASYCVPRALCFENLWFGATSGASTARYRYKFSGTVRFDSALYAYAFLMMTVATTETGVQSDDCTVAWSHDGTDLVITITDTEGTMFGAVSSGYDNITKISGLLFYEV